jgi:hypothetical protein
MSRDARGDDESDDNNRHDEALHHQKPRPWIYWSNPTTRCRDSARVHLGTYCPASRGTRAADAERCPCESNGTR